MSIESKTFLKINDKRYELISDSDSGIINYARVIGNILIEKLNINMMYKFNGLMQSSKVEIHETTSEKLTINDSNKSETNIKFTNNIMNKDNNTSFHTIFKNVKVYLGQYYIERDKELEKKRLEEAETQEAKKIKLEQEKIEKERIKKEKEEAELHRLATVGRICEKFFEFAEMNENFENRYNGNATFKIKPSIEGKSIIQHRIIGKREPYNERRSDRVRLQACISENNNIEFRW